MIVEEQHVITLTYDLRDTDRNGELLERTDVEDPFTFLFGIGQLLPSFEARLRGLKEGDHFSFTLTPEDAYGESIPENIVDIPMENFQVEGEIPENILTPGNFITMQDSYGQEHFGRVVSHNLEFARIDFNHVMAGRILHFDGNIHRIRKATADEMDHGHHHPQEGEAGHHHHHED